MMIGFSKGCKSAETATSSGTRLLDLPLVKDLHVQIDTNRALTFLPSPATERPSYVLRIDRKLNMLQKRTPILRPNSYDPFSAGDRRFEIRPLRLA